MAAENRAQDDLSGSLRDYGVLEHCLSSASLTFAQAPSCTFGRYPCVSHRFAISSSQEAIAASISCFISSYSFSLSYKSLMNFVAMSHSASRSFLRLSLSPFKLRISSRSFFMSCVFCISSLDISRCDMRLGL